MGCFSEVQQFLNFLETFPGNFGTIWPRFQIVGKFGSMKSTEDILYYLTSGEMETFSKRFIIQICSAQLAYNFMLTRFEVKTSNTSLTSFLNTRRVENMTHGGVFFRNFEMFGNVDKPVLSCSFNLKIILYLAKIIQYIATEVLQLRSPYS